MIAEVSEGISEGGLEKVAAAILFFLLGFTLGWFLPRFALYLLRDQVPKAALYCKTCQIGRSRGLLSPAIPPQCEVCGTFLSPSSVTSALLTGLVYGTLWMVIGWTGELVIALILAPVLLIAWLTDQWCRLILDRVTIPSAILFLLLRLGIQEEAWVNYLFAFLFGGGVLLFLGWISRGGMGGGDAKLLAMGGAALGFPDVLTAFGLAVFSGGLWSLILLVTRRADYKEAIPFGFHLAIGIFVAFLWSETLVKWYLSTFL